MRSRFCLFALTLSFIPSGAAAETFVPFVIPARPDPKSPIAYPVSNPINTDSERLVVRHGHFYGGGNRVRLWGVNLSFGANLPSQQDAPHIAARLAAAGVNTVRCHHLDTARWPRGIWNAKDGRNIAPEALDRLDFFIDQLARRAVYVNINLHVGRAHSEYLGLPKANREYDKISNIFTPALIDAQKQYAREILTHINKYRKVRYADDPAVAIVEITNENSFFMWGSEDTLRTLPPYYAEILQARFNDWLKKRYGSTTKLRAAWSEGAQPLGKNLLTNADFQRETAGAGAPQDWHLEQHLPCKATASRRRYHNRDALRLSPGKIDDTEWHLQFNQSDLPLEAGKYYTVTFEAAGEKPRTISCGVSQAHSPWANLGLSKRVELTEKWQKFRYGFVAKEDDDNARISFAFGVDTVPLYIANVTLQAGGRTGLQEDESIEAGNVALFAESETTARTTDRMCFLAGTEKAYFDDMRSFIRNELGCKALVTGTIVFGPLGLYAQSDMDFIDAHAYWQHPRFPGRPWDSGNWLIDQKPMTDHPDQATLFRLAAQRLHGKPYTVSEYNHPAPLDSQAECVPMIASFAAAQDWDGVWLYTYSHSSDDWDREHLNSYFDIDTNPAKWGFMRAGAAIFRDAGIEPLTDSECMSLAESEDLLTDLAGFHLRHDRDMFALLSARDKITRSQVLNARLFATFESQAHKDLLSAAPTTVEWTVEDEGGLYYVSGKKAAAAVGLSERLNKIMYGPSTGVTSPAFLTMTMTALDGQPIFQSKKILLTACGRCENTGMQFSQDRTTVATNWGAPPVQVEPLRGTFPLSQDKDDWRCQALGPDGMPTHQIPIIRSDGRCVIELSSEQKTMWFLFTR